MSSQDFVRHMDFGVNDLSRRKSIFERLHIDFPLLIVLLILIGFGLMVLYSATDGNAIQLRRQVAFIILSFVVMLVVAQIDVHKLRRWVPWMYVGTLSLLVAVIYVGSSGGGAQRWLEIPFLPRFQPSEIMKIVLPQLRTISPSAPSHHGLNIYSGL
ncbi:MAG: FtsW/RodA/SpoVE family cell cycle protein [Pseudomonadales bacterium]